MRRRPPPRRNQQAHDRARDGDFPQIAEEVMHRQLRRLAREFHLEIPGLDDDRDIARHCEAHGRERPHQRDAQTEVDDKAQQRRAHRSGRVYLRVEGPQYQVHEGEKWQAQRVNHEHRHHESRVGGVKPSMLKK